MAAIMIVRKAVAVGVFTLLATTLIAAGCNKQPAAQVSRLTDHAQAPRLTDQEIRQKILAASLLRTMTVHAPARIPVSIARVAVPMTSEGNPSAFLVM